jgi:hypothetical protein
MVIASKIWYFKILKHIKYEKMNRSDSGKKYLHPVASIMPFYNLASYPHHRVVLLLYKTVIIIPVWPRMCECDPSSLTLL